MADQTNSTAFRDLLAGLADTGLTYFVTLHSAITGLTIDMTYAGTGISEMPTASGYTLGGQTVALSHTGGTGGVLDGPDITWTAAGTDLGPVSYAAFWATTGGVIAGSKCIAIKDSSGASAQTATVGNTMTVSITDMITIPQPA